MDADEWDRKYDTRELIWNADPNRFVAELCGDLLPGRAIDLAAGEGRNAVWLATKGWDATAVDFSPVALEKARELAANNEVRITTVEADLTRWSPEPGIYDLVLIAYLQLPHDEERSVIADAEAAVAPGGTFVFVAHDLSNIENGHGGPQDPSVLPDPDLVVDALTELEVARAEVVERPVATDEGERIALDTLVLAQRPA